MIAGFKSKALKRYWTKGDASGVRADWQRKVKLILNALHAARDVQELNLPGFGLHALTGDMAGRHAIWVSRNWRITFVWDDDSAVDVDLEDYHGN